MPVDYYIHAQVGAPFCGLVKELKILFRSTFAPCHRMHRYAYYHGTHLFHLFKMCLVPVTLSLDLVGIGNRHPSEEYCLSTFGNEFIALDLYKGQSFSFGIWLGHPRRTILKPWSGILC